MKCRLSARGRLTILYTALVLGAGLAIAGLTYVLVGRALADRPRTLRLFGPLDASIPPVPDPGVELAAIDRLHADTLAQLLTQSLIALTIVGVLAAVLSWVVAGRVLRPIRTMSATAQRLSAENLSERVPVTTPADELATLAETVNGMLDRIQSGVAERDRLLHSQRMFVANAAHELRTPLTTMRTAVEVTLDGKPSNEELLVMAGDVRDAVADSQRTLDGLLALARSQTGLARRQQVDLADVVTRIIEAARGQAEAGRVELRPALRPSAVMGDPVLLDRMVSNLVDNAIRYNEAGGNVVVSTGLVAGRAQLRIVNTGQHVAPAAVHDLFTPFVRGRASRPHDDGGLGLGLSIVRAVVDAHQGQLTTDVPAAGGLDITTGFPGAR
ncbi:HAMP domain-containing protein [Lentzea sp. PSKA42]|uniref:histidine kinase n=1 Tax=Lentzea indica TaxID=2604800 RepID=A0ABX1FXQ0_9PSEU|nr:ATP-binding protein [Lentzea indica]NKE63133.1 HAMP domain-containing protein [Lentzea indica]